MKHNSILENPISLVFVYKNIVKFTFCICALHGCIFDQDSTGIASATCSK